MEHLLIRPGQLVGLMTRSHQLAKLVDVVDVVDVVDKGPFGSGKRRMRAAIGRQFQGWGWGYRLNASCTATSHIQRISLLIRLVNQSVD
jgi:hypothetical protein